MSIRVRFLVVVLAAWVVFAALVVGSPAGQVYPGCRAGLC